jgi:hypothetical protein
MRRFFKWLKCALSGHPRNICALESIDGQLWATSEECACGAKVAPMFPGAAVKARKHHYEEVPTEWPEMFGDFDTVNLRYKKYERASQSGAPLSGDMEGTTLNFGEDTD